MIVARMIGQLQSATGVGLLSIMILALSGCASEPPRPAPAVTPDQVRGHADKTFEKLKQEEQNRPMDQTVPR
jgi:hypothetical protein